MAVIPRDPNRFDNYWSPLRTVNDRTLMIQSDEYMSRPDYLKSSKRDTFEMDSISKVVPVYRIKDDVRGQFLERFLDTFARMNDLELVAISQVKKFYNPYKGKKRDYAVLYVPIITINYTSKIKGSFRTSSGIHFVLTDTASQWISRWGLEKTEGTITVGCLTVEKILMRSCASYSALLFTTDNGKVNPVKILCNGYRIQTTNGYNKKWSNWIDSFYSKHSLPPGCDFHTQIHEGWDELSILPL